MTTPHPRTFPDVWTAADDIPGWLTRDQGELLWDTATALPEQATAIEIGSHQGRSTVVLGQAMRERSGRLVAIDPFVEGRLFGGTPTRERFEANMSTVGLSAVVELVPEFSTALRPSWSRPADLLYIDGKHDYWTFTDDLRWAVHLHPGAPVLVHDCFSSIGVTLGVLARVLPSRTLTYERRAGSLALFRIGRPTARDRWRIAREMPWWTRNVGIKVLLRLRLGRVAEAFGHDGPYDPY